MSELDSYELGEEPRDSQEPSPASAGNDRRKLLLIVAAAAVVLIAVIGFWIWGRRPPAEPMVGEIEQPAKPIAEAVVEEVVEDEAEPMELPALDASDLVVRDLAAALSANPQFAAWLVNEDLIRRFVVAVDNMAEGETPRVHLGFMAPEASFRTWEVDGQLHVSPTSYRRYDAMTEAFLSLDSEGSVELYRRLEPLAQQAYRDLGYPNRSFEDTLRKAARSVLDTPRIEGTVELEAGVRSYRFADPELEQLDPLQKQLIRLGPRNLAKIQAKVRSLLAELDKTESAAGR